jgi:epoxyqueuosine reductase
MNVAAEHTRLIKNKAAELGFLFCGISTARFLEEEAPRLESWLNRGLNAKLDYMANYFDKRLDPRLLVEGAKSIVSLAYNYYPSEHQREDSYHISKYAYGVDYHFVVKDKMKELFEYIQEAIGEVDGRMFVDSAPVLDKAWAKNAGLGWVGKHTLLLNPKHGSFFFVSELILDLELIPDEPIKDYCGTCTKCIDACPTNAIVEPYVVDASKCISYLTIELKDALIENNLQAQMSDWMFGCDICQDVCPWNRFAKPHNEPLFQPNDSILNFSKNDWEEITEEVYREVFKNSPIKRAKFSGLTRNIQALKK